MKTKIVQTGGKFQLCISSPDKDPKQRIEIGIMMKGGTFDPESNYVAVLVEDSLLRVIIRDLTARLNSIH